MVMSNQFGQHTITITQTCESFYRLKIIAKVVLQVTYNTFTIIILNILKLK